MIPTRFPQLVVETISWCSFMDAEYRPVDLLRTEALTPRETIRYFRSSDADVAEIVQSVGDTRRQLLTELGVQPTPSLSCRSAGRPLAPSTTCAAACTTNCRQASRRCSTSVTIQVWIPGSRWFKLLRTEAAGRGMHSSSRGSHRISLAKPAKESTQPQAAASSGRSQRRLAFERITELVAHPVTDSNAHSDPATLTPKEFYRSVPKKGSRPNRRARRGLKWSHLSDSNRWPVHYE